MIGEIKEQIRQILVQLNAEAKLQPGDLVIGCSTSRCYKHSTASSMEVAAALVEKFSPLQDAQYHPAFRVASI